MHSVHPPSSNTLTQGRTIIVLEFATSGERLHQVLDTFKDNETVVAKRAVTA